MAFTITERSEPVVPGARTQRLFLDIDPPIDQLDDDDLAKCAAQLWEKAFHLRDVDWKKGFVYDDNRAVVLEECIRRGLET